MIDEYLKTIKFIKSKIEEGKTLIIKGNTDYAFD